ncbi:transporter [Lentilactobacillus sp. SPB1-3]|uniref:Transporter n=1 Tax=Lentilactobacillus terminaliae TaxID=3003483 RepID=A0ACD5DD07_9LACO|nr:transporter [Lentilactobacillus sp. SPB1-3]MCZ0978142.1 transporter [Lentilactobacillus sp. SPB1-3]
MKLKLNMWTAIDDIINVILFFFSWFLIIGAAFSDGGGNQADNMANFLLIMALIGLALNIISLIRSHKVNISIVGPILGIIGNVVYLFGAWAAFPAIVLLIIASVFSFMQHPVKNNNESNNPVVH